MDMFFGGKNKVPALLVTSDFWTCFDNVQRHEMLVFTTCLCLSNMHSMWKAKAPQELEVVLGFA